MHRYRRKSRYLPSALAAAVRVFNRRLQKCAFADLTTPLRSTRSPSSYLAVVGRALRKLIGQVFDGTAVLAEVIFADVEDAFYQSIFSPHPMICLARIFANGAGCY